MPPEDERRSPPPDESPLQVIGQLAGGIAHDFNNILGVIINYARFAQGSVPPGSPAAADIEEIKRAAERGVGLVRQLMILARRESGATVVFDLNELITGLDGFLRSTIGEHITVERRLDPLLGNLGIWSRGSLAPSRSDSYNVAGRREDKGANGARECEAARSVARYSRCEVSDDSP